jgi:hypothetical protein
MSGPQGSSELLRAVWTIQAGFVRKWIFSSQTHNRGTKWTRQFRNTNFIRHRQRMRKTIQPMSSWPKPKVWHIRFRSTPRRSPCSSPNAEQSRAQPCCVCGGAPWPCQWQQHRSPVPNWAALCARCATLALQISFWLGRQAMFGQEPPIHRRSTTAVRRPNRPI